jgi:hypothetical protein
MRAALPARRFLFPAPHLPRSMRRILSLAALVAFAAPAAAQPEIRPGQTVSGELTGTDPVVDTHVERASHYDLWSFRGEPAHVYHVTLRSQSFDAFLAVGADAAAGCRGCDTDDDGGGGHDAELRFVPDAAGTFQIRATAYDADSGAYRLTLEDEGLLARPDSVAAPGQLLLGALAAGRLESTDERSHGSYIDTYTYRGRAGETIVVTLRSADFDTTLRMGMVEHAACRALPGDDNGGGGTDSRLRVHLPHDGVYHVHISSTRAGATGAYTVTVQPG